MIDLLENMKLKLVGKSITQITLSKSLESGIICHLTVIDEPGNVTTQTFVSKGNLLYNLFHSKTVKQEFIQTLLDLKAHGLGNLSKLTLDNLSLSPELMSFMGDINNLSEFVLNNPDHALMQYAIPFIQNQKATLGKVLIDNCPKYNHKYDIPTYIGQSKIISLTVKNNIHPKYVCQFMQWLAKEKTFSITEFSFVISNECIEGMHRYEKIQLVDAINEAVLALQNANIVTGKISVPNIFIPEPRIVLFSGAIGARGRNPAAPAVSYQENPVYKPFGIE